MAQIDSDLVGIVIACSVCVICACIMSVLAGVYCHRRMLRKRQQASSRQNLMVPYLLPVDRMVPHSVGHAPSIHESVGTLSAYRPKILTSHGDRISESEYQQVLDTPHPSATVGHSHQSDYPDQGEAEKESGAPGQESMQYFSGPYRSSHTRKGIVMTAVEPYRIIEPVPIIPYHVHSQNSYQKRNSESLDQPSSLSEEVKRTIESPRKEISERTTSEEEEVKEGERGEGRVAFRIVSYEQVNLPEEHMSNGQVQTNVSSTRVVQSQSIVHRIESDTTALVQNGGLAVTETTISTAGNPPETSQEVVITDSKQSAIDTYFTTDDEPLKGNSNLDVSACVKLLSFFTISSLVSSDHKSSSVPYEDKVNSVDFESEADIFLDDTAQNGQGAISNGLTAGLVSMRVKDYSCIQASSENTSAVPDRKARVSDDYTILDYVDPNQATSNIRRNFHNVMKQIESRQEPAGQHVTGHHERWTQDAVDFSAEKVPPALTSTPRAPPEVTKPANNRQRNEYEGSVTYPPDKDLLL